MARIYHYLSAYPSISETFIENQINALIAQRADLCVIANKYRSHLVVGSSSSQRQVLQRLRTLLESATPFSISGVRNTASALFGGRLVGIPSSLRLYPTLAKVAGKLAPYAMILKWRVESGRILISENSIIHCQFGPQARVVAALMAVCPSLLPESMIVNFRGRDAFVDLPANPASYRHVFEHAARVLCVSESIREQVLRYACPPEKASIHYSGIYIDRFPYQEPSRLCDKSLRILFVGRLVEKKGVFDLVSALEILHRRGVAFNAEIVGDGPLRAALHERVRQSGIESFVNFRGPLKHGDVLYAYQRADVMVCPSKSSGDGDQEGIPNTIKEAMASGTPVIATRHSGNTEIVFHRKTGLLVDEAQPDQIANMLMTVINGEIDRSRISRRARRLIEDRFDIHKLTSDLMCIYEQLMSSNAGT